MSYARSMGDTASDVMTGVAAGTQALSQIFGTIAASHGGATTGMPGAYPMTPGMPYSPTPTSPYGTSPYGTPGAAPYGMVYDPNTGTYVQQTDYTPWVIGGIAVLGVVGFMMMRRRGVSANRRRSRRNRRRRRVSHNKLSARRRASLPLKSFVFPTRRAWPIDNARRAYAAIQMMRLGRVANASEYNAIRNTIRSRYPRVWDIYGKHVTWTRVKAAKAKARSSRRRTVRGTRRRKAA